MEFEWDLQKAKRNYQKHRVDFSEASTVFGDTLSITFYDPDHSVEEDRFLIIGLSVQGRELIVSHTDREDKVRIISAREVTHNEGKLYESKSRNATGR